MSRLLPIQPDLEHLKNEAKALLKAHGKREPAAAVLFRKLRRLANATDAEVFSAPVTLTEAQFVLSLEYGFRSWDELRKTVPDTSEQNVTESIHSFLGRYNFFALDREPFGDRNDVEILAASALFRDVPADLIDRQ